MIEILNNNAAKKFRILINSFKKSKILIPNESYRIEITQLFIIFEFLQLGKLLQTVTNCQRFLIEKMFDSRAFQLEYLSQIT